jgi:hypothetical protein
MITKIEKMPNVVLLYIKNILAFLKILDLEPVEVVAV